MNMSKMGLKGINAKVLIITLFLIFLATAIVFKLFALEIFPSQFYGALIGVVITALITMLLLEGQSASEKERRKDVKIFEQRIRVYSKFTDKMWTMLDDNVISNEKLKELQKICFRKLVFYLNREQINEIHKQISDIDSESEDSAQHAVAEITHILQNSLDTAKNANSSEILTLFNSFNRKKFDENEEIEQKVNLTKGNTLGQRVANNVRYWHFNILNVEQQLEAFKNGNWVLALIEYGEDWRTNAIRQVKQNDIIFLFKRGGAGYIGAFRALNEQTSQVPYKVLEAGNTYSDTDISKYDIYRGLADGASLSSNILVKPIAYNYKGIGYYSVRRRTIERMNDLDSVGFLLNRFKGNDLPEGSIEGKDKLDADTFISNEIMDSDFFNSLIE